jgi:hypothetical protein
MTEQTVNMDMDALLDGTLEDLADAPAWEDYPPGAHLVEVTKIERFMVQNDATKQGMKFHFKAKQTLEATDPEKVVSPDQVATLSFFLVHPSETAVKQGQGQFKEIMAVAAAQYGAAKNSELCEKLVGSEVILVTDLRPEKKDGKATGRNFLQFKGMAFPD